MISASIEREGFAMAPGVVSGGARRDLLRALGTSPHAGRRGVLDIPEIASLARSSHLINFVAPHTTAEPWPVRAIYFDKSARANWLVAWHQDITVAVCERIDVAGFGPWSVKQGITHVQPPAEILERMLTVRLHLDDCDETNGALRVLPGTHRLGRLSAERIRQLRADLPEIPCCLSAGDILLMRPLLLHASGKTLSNRHRRVLHIEYAGCQLPGGLRWYDSKIARRKEKGAVSGDCAKNRKQN